MVFFKILCIFTNYMTLLVFFWLNCFFLYGHYVLQLFRRSFPEKSSAFSEYFLFFSESPSPLSQNNISYKHIIQHFHQSINRQKKALIRVPLKSFFLYNYASSAKYLIVLTICDVYEFSLSYQETTCTS